MRILLVDDIVVNRFILREIVKNLGHEFAEAENGRKAIEWLEKQKFDMVFLDIEMPVMNGIETSLYIRNKMPAPTNAIKIYAITAYNPTILHEELDVSAFNGIITKPYSIEKIKHLLEITD